MSEYHIIIDGEPIGKARPRLSSQFDRKVIYTPKRTQAYETRIKYLFYEKYGKIVKVPTTAYKCEIRAYYTPNVAFRKHERILALENKIPMFKKPDIDNVIKIVLDALNGIVYDDDRQVVSVYAIKQYSDEPRIEITIKGE